VAQSQFTSILLYLLFFVAKNHFTSILLFLLLFVAKNHFTSILLFLLLFVAQNQNFRADSQRRQRSYTVFGKVDLSDSVWLEMKENTSLYRFFKVTIEVK